MDNLAKQKDPKDGVSKRIPNNTSKSRSDAVSKDTIEHFTETCAAFSTLMSLGYPQDQSQPRKKCGDDSGAKMSLIAAVSADGHVFPPAFYIKGKCLQPSWTANPPMSSFWRKLS
eukprot:m.32834 g.32834  ORF g.32834 m.32834 type:complete len:115 (+) comp8456_c0_seq1:123-467(+)